MRPWQRWLLAAGVVGAVVVFFALRPSTKSAPTLAADFAYPDLKGRPVALSSLRGQLVFLDFWATWCDPCRDEVPDLITLQKDFSAKGFTVLGVATDANGKAAVAPFVRENGINYPVLISEGEIPEGYPVPGFPTAFLIGRDGRVLRRYLGGYPYEELAHDVQEALGR